MRIWAISMFVLIVMIVMRPNGSSVAHAQAVGNGAACSLISPSDITKATGITVGPGDPGKPIPGTLGKCTWTAADRTKVILTLADAQHMRIAVEAQQQTGGAAVPGVGTSAVGIQGALRSPAAAMSSVFSTRRADLE